MSGGWIHGDPAPFGGEETYAIAAEWLDVPGCVVEDWGCGSGWARRYFKSARYVGVDGSPGQGVDVVEDLIDRRSEPDCILMRHVLEHNARWEEILANAVGSFRRRMALVTYTPLLVSADHASLLEWIEGGRFLRAPVPVFALPASRVRNLMSWILVHEHSLATGTDYGHERVFLLDKTLP